MGNLGELLYFRRNNQNAQTWKIHGTNHFALIISSKTEILFIFLQTKSTSLLFYLENNKL